jgi:LmbE family N-acetylglucosaminyl deacetylase
MPTEMHDEHTDHPAGGGTPAADWLAWPGLAAIARTSADELLPDGARAVVVAPHPDDEVIAVGGLLAQLAAQEREICVIAVTDGIARPSEAPQWPPDNQTRTRHVENRRALRRLGVADDPVRLGFPDGSLQILRRMLAERLMPLLRSTDVVFTTWRMDGPPDHEATGHACAFAAARAGARLVETPVRAWHWAAPGDVRMPWRRARQVMLDDDALGRKQKALDTFDNTLHTRPSALVDSSQCNNAVAHAAGPFEVMFT